MNDNGTNEPAGMKYVVRWLEGMWGYAIYFKTKKSAMKLAKQMKTKVSKVDNGVDVAIKIAKTTQAKFFKDLKKRLK